MGKEGVKKGSIIGKTAREERQKRTRTGRIIVLIPCHCRRRCFAKRSGCAAASGRFSAGERQAVSSLFFQKPQLAGEPAGGGRLEEDGDEDRQEGDRCDNLRPGDLHPEKDAGERPGDHAGLPGPAHEEELPQAPFRQPVGEGAHKDCDRPGNEDEDQDEENASSQVLPHEEETDLAPEEDEDEHPHDQGGSADEIRQSLLFFPLQSEPEGFLVAEDDAEHEDRHEAAGVEVSALR